MTNVTPELHAAAATVTTTLVPPAAGSAASSQIKRTGTWNKSLKVRRGRTRPISAGTTIGEEPDQSSVEAYSERIAALDRMRLGSEDHDDLAIRAYRENVECWWVLYKSWKQSREPSRLHWQRWLQDVKRKGVEERDYWPEPPPVLEIPCVMTKVHEATIKHELMQRLAQTETVQQMEAVERMSTLQRLELSSTALITL